MKTFGNIFLYDHDEYDVGIHKYYNCYFMQDYMQYNKGQSYMIVSMPENKIITYLIKYDMMNNVI
jgi:hypothetical protein